MINIPLGMNVKNNPITTSQYVQPNDEVGFSPVAPDGILTESGIFIVTESGVFLSTE
jgi:hypothetical protein